MVEVKDSLRSPRHSKRVKKSIYLNYREERSEKEESLLDKPMAQPALRAASSPTQLASPVAKKREATPSSLEDMSPSYEENKEIYQVWLPSSQHLMYWSKKHLLWQWCYCEKTLTNLPRDLVSSPPMMTQALERTPIVDPTDVSCWFCFCIFPNKWDLMWYCWVID